MEKKVLYVDDEADIREIARMSLELDPGLCVRECSSGAEALDIAAIWEPDLILLDVMMPEMDGPETMLRLNDRAGQPPARVVFVTARTQRREVDGFLDLGALGVIAKPFDPLSLSLQVRTFLSEADAAGAPDD